jgi:hypothetical protein
MQKYILSLVLTGIQTVAYIRQNCWRKIDDIFESVIKSKRLHIPWAHTKSRVDMVINGEDIALNNKGGRYVNIAKNLEVGSLVLIPDGKKGLIVRITSEIKADIFDSICIACRPRSCGHTHVTGCDGCRSSIVEVFNPSNVEKLVRHLKAGCLIEPFYSPYRDVEIVGEADFNGTDGRSVAGPDSAGNWPHYWAAVE